MVREKDVCWEYCEKLEGNKVRCKFCLKVLNGGISRLKHHLSRLPSKGVLPCSKVRDDVTDRVRAIIAMKEEGKEAASAKKQRLVEAKPPITIPTNKTLMCMEMPPLAKPFPSITQVGAPISYDSENAERSIALFFFENKLDFSVARSSSYQLMMEAVAKCGTGFTGPSFDSLKSTWLERIKSEVSEQSKEIEKEWEITGCTIIADTWTDNKSRAIINFLVSSPSGIFFHKSVDASNCFKNTKFLADLFDSVIQDFGAENVVQVIMDSALNYVGVGNYIMQNYSTIFCTPCASHCLNLILEDFCKIDWVNRCILQAQSISRFIYNQTWVLDLMKNFTGGQELVRTGITKSASNFLSLQSMLKLRSRLKHMFNCPEYSNNPSYANKQQSLTCIDILEDNDFWKAVDECVSVSEPLLKVLREVTGGKPVVGSIYELMTKAKESIRTYYIMDEDETKCKTFLDIVDRRWQNQLHSPLHAAAAFLNPSIQYNPEVKFLGGIKEEFFTVLEKLLPTPELRQDLTGQIFVFKKAQGLFGCNLAREARNTISPGFNIWLTSIKIQSVSMLPYDYHYEMAQGGSTSAPSSQSEHSKGPRDFRIDVAFTQNGKAIGPHAADYSTYLGKATRTHCPPTYEFWTDIDPTCKEELWKAIMGKYVVPEEEKENQLQHAKKLWVNWKSTIRRHMDKYETIPEKKANKLHNVKKEDWEFLVDHQLSNDANLRRVKGKGARSQVKYLHLSGRRGSARTAEKLLAKDPTNPGTRTYFFMAMHTRDDGSFLSEEIAEKMNEINGIVARDPSSKHKDLDHDLVAQVTGKKDGRGYVRGYGDHVSKTTLMAAAPYKRKAQEMQDSYVELLSQVGSLKSQLSEETTARLKLQEKVDALLSMQGPGHDLRTQNSTASYEVPADRVSGPSRVQRDTSIPSR